MKTLIRKFPVVSYFIIAFGWTWSIVLYMIFSGSVDVNSPTPLFVIGGIICNISPSIAAFIVLKLSEGKEGTAKLVAGFKKKIAARYLIPAVLTVPVITMITAIISSQFLIHYEVQITVPLLVMGLVWPLFSGFGEEFGWRGFILPSMMKKLSPLKAGLILGIIWETWHIPMHYMSYKNFGDYMIPAFITVGFINLTLQTLIMTYLYVKSGGSIRLMIMYHYTITASSIILSAFFKMDTTPQLTVYESIISVTLFLVFTLVLYIRKTNKSSANLNSQVNSTINR